MMPTIGATWTSRSTAMPGAGRARSLVDVIGSLAAVGALFAFIVPAVIQQSPADPADARANADGASSATLAPPTREFMLGAYGGAPYTYASDVTVKKPGVHDFTAKDVGWDGEPFDNPIYYGARVVRWLGARTGTMIDFTHSKTLARLGEEVLFTGQIDGKPAPERAKLRDVFRRLEASHGHNMLTLNGLLRLPSLGLRLHPYVGLGAGVALPHSEVHLASDPKRTYEYQYAGPVAQALVGIEIRVPRMSYFVEYKFTFADYAMPLTHRDGSLLFLDLWQQFERWRKGEEPPGGWLTTRLASHQAIAGLAVRLGAVPTAP